MNEGSKYDEKTRKMMDGLGTPLIERAKMLKRYDNQGDLTDGYTGYCRRAEFRQVNSKNDLDKRFKNENFCKNGFENFE